MTSVATYLMSAALFTRRSRSGWLDELDDIRGGALASPDGEVSSAMADVAPLPESDTSPLADLGSATDPASWPMPELDPTDRQDSAGLEAVEPAPTPAGDAIPPPVERAPDRDDAPAPIVSDAPAPVAVAAQEAAGTAEAELPPAPVEADLGREDQPVVDEPIQDEALLLLPPPPHAAEVTPPAAPADAAPAVEPAPEPVVVQPSPHPIRPQEMWHPQVAVASLPPRPEERLDQADLLADDAGATKAARFRFARLRAVTPEGGALVGSDEREKAAPGPPAPRADFDLFGRERPTAPDESPLGSGAAPLVPERPAGGGGALITGPVARRRQQRDAEPARRRKNRIKGDAAEPEAEEAATPALAARPAWQWDPEATEPSPEAEAEAQVEAQVEVEVEVEIEEAVEQAEAVDAAASAEMAAPDEEAVDTRPEATAVEPAVVEVPADPTPLAVAPDGTVAVDEGIVRLADGHEIPVLEDAEGVRLDLTGGWCWADRPDGASVVTVTLAVGTLTLPGGTVALVVAEADGTAFVVVVGGEAQLAHAGGRLRLRSGALVLASPGSEPKVDVAVGSEILSDRLVQHNLRLDAAR